ncbi:DUF6479 family protein [Streptomyces sp. NPDC088097]|uniref:DUF6479 family protein n=1 Tax=Streptomyces sp. NPDC088097 TaxID=3365823 RepID=UPI003815949A
MDTTVNDLAVDMKLTNIAWFLFVGLLLVGFLISAFIVGRRVRVREPAPPDPGTQPHLPAGGPVYEVREEREHVGFPPEGLGPHQMLGYGNLGSRTSTHPEETRAARDAG